MKIISKLNGKLLKWYGIALILTIVMMFKSCNKDEQEEKKGETHFLPTEPRTGQHVPVYADSTAVLFNTNPADSTETIFDLSNIDSIKYVSPPPYRDIGFNGTYCWEYITTIYSGGDIKRFIAYSKYRGVTHTQVPGSNEGMGTDFFFKEVTRTNQTVTDFDYGCTRNKLKHNYQVKTRRNGQTVETNEVISSTNCNTNILQFKKIFKR